MAQPASAVDAVASPEAEATGRWGSLLECSLVVPFLTPLDADIACWFLGPEAERQRQVLYKRLTVLGSNLVIVLRSEDPCLLRMCLDFLLDQLSVVLQAMQHCCPRAR
ncbi:EKC/KEOPS complex subunit LAGE3-like [Erinaceus europaeus]|uniref:EKC/KEOPS complex subunit LAGE3-like n=1 Tax=Erinaceus europaeus TaxID=9365 RepID=A0ABM3WS69_ERIEU|nr:EKC/KEOPS complex subunit LAGE3-like [Erinaceus europaeus]XP_060039411.1 EKC/KEOPS complex subunit LAGE3-like [Erinaceus europaeus]